MYSAARTSALPPHTLRRPRRVPESRLRGATPTKAASRLCVSVPSSGTPANRVRARTGPTPGSLVLALAPALRQSQELFAKIAGFYKDLGRPVAPHGERKLSLDLENGSRILTLPGSEKTVRGFSGVGLLIVDEAARVEDQLYYATRPMLAVSGGSLMMLSTPASKRGVFYTEWTSGEGWERYEVRADDCPRITRAFLEEERKALPPPVFRAEYECSFEALDDQPFSEARSHPLSLTRVLSPYSLGCRRVLDWCRPGPGRRLLHARRGP
jgi:hypothetical protein